MFKSKVNRQCLAATLGVAGLVALASLAAVRADQTYTLDATATSNCYVTISLTKPAQPDCVKCDGKVLNTPATGTGGPTAKYYKKANGVVCGKKEIGYWLETLDPFGGTYWACTSYAPPQTTTFDCANLVKYKPQSE